jgi:AraC-like DNA-binding protein
LSGTGIAFAVDYETLSAFAAGLRKTIGVTPLALSPQPVRQSSRFQ